MTSCHQLRSLTMSSDNILGLQQGFSHLAVPTSLIDPPMCFKLVFLWLSLFYKTMNLQEAASTRRRGIWGNLNLCSWTTTTENGSRTNYVLFPLGKQLFAVWTEQEVCAVCEVQEPVNEGLSWAQQLKLCYMASQAGATDRFSRKHLDSSEQSQASPAAQQMWVYFRSSPSTTLASYLMPALPWPCYFVSYWNLCWGWFWFKILLCSTGCLGAPWVAQASLNS